MNLLERALVREVLKGRTWAFSWEIRAGQLFGHFHQKPSYRKPVPCGPVVHLCRGLPVWRVPTKHGEPQKGVPSSGLPGLQRGAECGKGKQESSAAVVPLNVNTHALQNIPSTAYLCLESFVRLKCFAHAVVFSYICIMHGWVAWSLPWYGMTRLQRSAGSRNRSVHCTISII